jgi:hypothetical protein
VKKSFNIQELSQRKSKRHGTKPMHPSLLRAFQRNQKHDLKYPGSLDLITTKQNKLPSFIDRLEHPTTSQFRQKAKLKMKISKKKDFRGLQLPEVRKIK